MPSSSGMQPAYRHYLYGLWGAGSDAGHEALGKYCNPGTGIVNQQANGFWELHLPLS